MAQAEPLSTNPLAHYPELQLFIAGEWVSKGDRKSQEVLNPATGEVLGELPHATEADLDRALAAAEEGFRIWRDKLPEERSAVLRKAASLMRERRTDHNSRFPGIWQTHHAIAHGIENVFRCAGMVCRGRPTRLWPGIDPAPARFTYVCG